MTFDFVADKRFQDLLERDYQELKRCLEISAVKSTLILSGSILEAILTEYFIQFPVNGKTESQLLKTTLAELIDLAVQEGVISEREKNLSSVVKDYRNLIHPGREIRKNEQFDSDSAAIATSVLNIVIGSIKSKYLTAYGYLASDVFEKLKRDWNFHVIYDKVILKLNHNERVKLLKYLVEYEIYEKGYWPCFEEEGYVKEREITNLEYIKEHIEKLKPLVENSIIKIYLKRLVQEVETGKSLDAYSLYNLFHEDLNMLSEEEQDIIVIYMLKLFNSVIERASDVEYEKTYSTIGKYIKTEKAQQALLDYISFCVVNFYHRDMEKEMNVFEQVFNSLPEGVKALAEKHLLTFLSPIEKLPADIKMFYDEAVKRGFIHPAH